MDRTVNERVCALASEWGAVPVGRLPSEASRLPQFVRLYALLLMIRQDA